MPTASRWPLRLADGRLREGWLAAIQQTHGRPALSHWGAIAKELNDAGIPTLRGMVNGPQSRCSVCWGGCEPALDRKRGAASF